MLDVDKVERRNSPGYSRSGHSLLAGRADPNSMKIDEHKKLKSVWSAQPYARQNAGKYQEGKGTKETCDDGLSRRSLWGKPLTS